MITLNLMLTYLSNENLRAPPASMSAMLDCASLQLKLGEQHTAKQAGIT